jgi:hypothetical protein
MVNVGVYIGYFQAGMLLLKACYGNPDVVVDAEAARLRVLGVVEPPSETQSVLGLTVDYEPAGLKRRPDHVRRGFVHAFEDGVVLRTEPVFSELLQVFFLEIVLAPTGLLDTVYVARVVHGGQILIRSRLGLDERVIFEESKRLTQLYGQPHPQRVEGVALAERIGLKRRVVDKHGLPAHEPP